MNVHVNLNNVSLF